MSDYLIAAKDVLRGTLHDLKFPSEQQPLIGRITDDIGLAPQAFSNEHLRYMFRAIQLEYIDGANRSERPTIPAILTKLEQIYRANGHIHDAAGLVAQWNAKIARIREQDRGENPIKNARILRASEIKMLVEEETKEFLKRLHGSLEPDQDISDFRHFLSGVETSRGSGTTLRDVLERGQGDYFRPQSTGYARLDGIRLEGPLAVKGKPYGGWMPGRLATFVGAQGVGKTSIAINLAARRTEMGMPVVFHSFEMDQEAIYRSIICSSAKISADMAFKAEGNEALRAVHDTVELWARVYDEPANIAGLERRYRRHQVEFGDDMVLHIIDHLWAFVEKGESAWKQVQSLGRAFKDLGRGCHACTLLLAHPSPDGNFETEFRAKNRVTKCHVYGGKGIAQWTDSLVAVGRHSGFEGTVFQPELAKTTIFQAFKNRQGKGIGENSYFGLRFYPETDYLSQEIVFDEQERVFNPKEPDPVYF